MRRTPALIIGGGPAGTVAAIGLAREGIKAVLVERDIETRDALCGGFLSWATIDRLKRLGIDPMLLGAHRIDRLVLYTSGKMAEAPLPALAAALSRYSLDTALLKQAHASGCTILRGQAVKAVTAGVARLDDAAMLTADCTILATGKHDLRGMKRGRQAADPAIGLRWRLEPSRALHQLIDGCIELHLFRGGYAGLARQEAGANLCLAVRRSVLAEHDGRPDLLLKALAHDHPALCARLDAAAISGPAQAIANVPYGWRAKADRDGLFRIGDQAGVIPSLAGEGIAIAIASGAAAAQAIKRGQSAHAFQSNLSAKLRRPIMVANILWRCAERPVGSQMMVQAARLAPTLTGLLAHLTRV